MKTKKTTRDPKRVGTTLIETVISISIFALFAAGSSKVILAQHKVSDIADSHYHAANLAKSRLEAIRAFQFADPSQIMDFEESNTELNQIGELDSGGQFRRITVCKMNADQTICEVTVTVQIRNRKTLKFDTGGETISSYFQ